MKRTHTAAGMIAALTLSPSLFLPVLAQSPAAQPTVTLAANTIPAPPSASALAAPLLFTTADVHVSAPTKERFKTGGWLDGDRYIVHHTTLIGLISYAYGVHVDNILGGPSWLDTNRYDISAQAPPGTSDDAVKDMLRNLLADRFKLAVHTDKSPMPAILVTAPKGVTGMKQSTSTAPSGCKFLPPADAIPGKALPVSFTCHAEPMDAFAHFLDEVMATHTQVHVDATGLKGLWDFSFTALYPPRTTAETVTNLQGLETQLGLKLEAGLAPLPVLFVDNISESPTPNPPGTPAMQPPPTRFDTVTIKPSSPDEKELAGQMGGGQINVTGISVQFLINVAWDFDGPRTVNPPQWLDQDRFDIVAKVAPGKLAADAPVIDNADFQRMIRKLLEEHFGLKWHMENRPTDAYALLVDNLKMKNANPLYHTECHEGPGLDGKDPRRTNPLLGRLLACQSITMAELARELPIRSTGYIKIPVFDATGLNGAYDLVLSYSGYSQVGGINEWSLSSSNTATHPSAKLNPPPGAILMYDAIEQQLGLKLEKQKRPTPMLVIDSINRHPIIN